MAPDLHELLRGAAHAPDDDIDVADVERRARRVGRARRLRAAGATVAVVAVVAVAGAMVDANRGRSVDLVDTPPPAPRGEATAEPESEGPWQPLPESPLSPRVDPVAVWTGSEVLIWAGQDAKYRSLEDGAAYDPKQRTWRRMSRAPVGSQYRVGGVWTGSELLVWAGDGPGDSGGGGAAYDPQADAWTRLPQGPMPARPGASVIWTGDEMIVWGGYGDEPGTNAADGAAYDPKTDTWRRLPAAPIEGRNGHAAVWTGAEMIIWGGATGDGAGTRHFDDGAAYDPATDEWRALTPGPLEGRADAIAAWTDAELLVVGGYGQSASHLTDAAAYDPVEDIWRPLERSPYAATFDALWVDGRLLVRGTTSRHGTPAKGAAVFSYPMNQWSRFADTDLAGQGAAMVVAGDQIIVWGGAREPNDAAEGAVSTGASVDVADLPPAVDDELFEDKASEPAAAEQPLVVWPTDDDEAPWRDDPGATAERFGREVLGWESARWEVGEPLHGPEGVHGFLTDPDGGSVDLGVIPTRGSTVTSDARGWAIAWAGAARVVKSADDGGRPLKRDLKERYLSVNIRDGRAEIGVGWPRGDIAAAELLLTYGENQVSQIVEDRGTFFDVAIPFPTDRPGSLLILFRDADGHVVTAQGTALPAGDFAAG